MYTVLLSRGSTDRALTANALRAEQIPQRASRYAGHDPFAGGTVRVGQRG
jgi:hypothetical protein